MSPPRPWFPSLCAEAPLAELQVRQTLALGLLPLGIALLLVAACAPDRPPATISAGMALNLVAMAGLWFAWRRTGRRHCLGYSTLHFLVRYLFIVLCPALLWTVFGEATMELAGWFPPILILLLLLVYPVGRLLRERVGPDPRLEPATETALLVCQQIEMVLCVFALVGLLSGIVVERNRNYPTDPTPLLLFLWMLALVAVLVGAVRAVAHWHQLYGAGSQGQALDDDPPARAPDAPPPPRFGSEQF